MKAKQKYEIQRRQADNILAWIDANEGVFMQLSDGIHQLMEVYDFDVNDKITQVDFNSLAHVQTLEVIKAFGGKWEKELAFGVQVTYTRVEPFNGVAIRCWAGEGPPSCKIVEEEVIIAAQYVPEHTEKRKKLVCK